MSSSTQATRSLVASFPKTALASRFGVRAAELALTDDRAHPLVVGAVGEHELDLVARTDVLEVRPAVSARLAAAGALEVHDLVHPRVDARTSASPLVSSSTVLPASHSSRHERKHAGLQQGLAARELDEGCAQREGARKDLLARHARAATKRLRRVAPRAAQVAPRRAHERAGQACERRLTLDARVDLVDHERVVLHGVVSISGTGISPASGS